MVLASSRKGSPFGRLSRIGCNAERIRSIEVLGRFRPLGAVPGDTSGESRPPSWPSFLRLLQEPITLSGTVSDPNLELPGFLSKDSRLRRKIDDLRKKDDDK